MLTECQWDIRSRFLGGYSDSGTVEGVIGHRLSKKKNRSGVNPTNFEVDNEETIWNLKIQLIEDFYNLDVCVLPNLKLEVQDDSIKATNYIKNELKIWI